MMIFKQLELWLNNRQKFRMVKIHISLDKTFDFKCASIKKIVEMDDV